MKRDSWDKAHRRDRARKSAGGPSAPSSGATKSWTTGSQSPGGWKRPPEAYLKQIRGEMIQREITRLKNADYRADGLILKRSQPFMHFLKRNGWLAGSEVLETLYSDFCRRLESDYVRIVDAIKEGELAFYIPNGVWGPRIHRLVCVMPRLNCEVLNFYSQNPLATETVWRRRGSERAPEHMHW